MISFLYYAINLISFRIRRIRRLETRFDCIKLICHFIFKTDRLDFLTKEQGFLTYFCFRNHFNCKFSCFSTFPKKSLFWRISLWNKWRNPERYLDTLQGTLVEDHFDLRTSFSSYYLFDSIPNESAVDTGGYSFKIRKAKLQCKGKVNTVQSTCGPRYLRTFYLRIRLFTFQKWLFSSQKWTIF